MKKELTNTQLKLMAMLFMLLDHIGATIVITLYNQSAASAEGLEVYYILRLIGRLAFPLFCFLIAEGITHTHNLSKYTLRMLIFALISELPFNLMCEGRILAPETQNVFWTFTLFLSAMTVAQKTKLPAAPLAIVAAALAWYLQTDYHWMGVGLLYIMTAKDRRIQKISGVLFITWMSFRLFGNPALGGILAIAPCFCFVKLLDLYNGKRGTGIHKYMFYGFYPVHMLLLWLVTTWILA
ncbi:TraX family protein [Clostridium porci]|uniref:TraX protein n=1 Tax=Clostridium porci TaxID=2605778 RepID=A0A7X2NKP2_9CLOT|nr:TraX family protein [Clostridium porci]MSS36558.1 hypothetical protein [Clostridium porci]